jgi:hypothetical protein
MRGPIAATRDEIEAPLKAEIARLRRDLEIWRRNGADIMMDAKIARLKTALKRMCDGWKNGDLSESDYLDARELVDEDQK